MARHICLAIPAYDWKVQLATMRAIFTDLQTLVARGDRVSLYDESGSTHLPDARAVNVARFLEDDGTDLVSIDNDVVWEAGALVRLVDAPVDLVAGIYPKRIDPLEFPLRYLPGDLWAVNGLLEVEAVPHGFLRYSRACLEKMVDAYPDLMVKTSKFHTGRMAALYRSVVLEDGTELEGDYSFCHRWRAIGGKVWIDPNITFGHIGFKVFQGNLGKWLKSREDYQWFKDMGTDEYVHHWTGERMSHDDFTAMKRQDAA